MTKNLEILDTCYDLSLRLEIINKFLIECDVNCPDEEKGITSEILELCAEQIETIYCSLRKISKVSLE